MHDKREDKKKCYHNCPRSQLVFFQYVQKDNKRIFLPYCYLSFHEGLVLDSDRRICNGRGCENRGRAFPDYSIEELISCAKRPKYSGHKNPEIIQYPVCTDKSGQFFPYCSKPDQRGIIYWDKFAKCEKENCPHLNKFRLPKDHRKKIKKPIILKCLQDLHPNMLRSM